MKIKFMNNILIEAMRHDEDRELFDHLVDDCGWQNDDASDCAAMNDFYTLEIRATNLDNIEKHFSVYLGGMIAKNWAEDTKNGAAGYLEQLIDEAIEGLE